MAPKRDHSALAASDYDDEPAAAPSASKRRREQQPQSSKPKQGEAKTDPTYGQRTAFPGLDDEGAAQISDDDLEFEECADALAYLRSVRQEASHVPHILVAPRAGPQLPPHLSSTGSDTKDDVDRSIYANGVGDSRGYYQDGAYTAAPDLDPSSSDAEVEEGEFRSEADIQAENKRALREAFYASLTAQFLSLRALLHQTPPSELVAALPKDHGTVVGSFGPKSWTFRVWTKRMRYTDPLPVQVAALDRGSVLRILRVILGGKFIRRGYELRERTSRWLWALLARLPDRGEMDYTEIGWVRELGKRAVLMMISMAHMAALQDEADADLGGEEFEEEMDEYGGDEEQKVEEEAVEGGEEPLADDDYSDVASEQAEQSSDPGHAATTDDGENDVSGDGGNAAMDIDDGEVVEDSNDATPNGDVENDIAAAKARLLAHLEETQKYSTKTRTEKPQHDTLEDDEDTRETSRSDQDRARLNMRATLNMILTVAGEFYGQRDLLEFRDPFPAV